jgi:hypothetical protein
MHIDLIEPQLHVVLYEFDVIVRVGRNT